jgi:calcium/calmodulin-dependent protein kinase I
MYRKFFVPTSIALTGVTSVAYYEYVYKKRKPNIIGDDRLTKDAVLSYEKLPLSEVYSRFKIKTLDKKDTDNVLGEGSYAHVIGCTELKTGKSVALKVVKKAFTRLPDFEREVAALTAARLHPNIVQLLDVLDVPDADSWLLVTELLEGGELFDRILQRGAFSETSAAVLIRKVASALSCLHKLGWAHNDVKPENLVYVTKAPNSEIKLIDFGMARKHFDALEPHEHPSISKDLGTTAYWSPEILNPKTRFTTDPRCIDAWTIGVLTYILIFGCHPFDRSGDATEEMVAQRIAQGSGPSGTSTEPYLSFDCFGDKLMISENAKHFLKSLLDPNPVTRMKVEEVMRHPWIMEATSQATLGVEQEQKSDAHSIVTLDPRRLRGERDAQKALAAMLKVATEKSALRDAYQTVGNPVVLRHESSTATLAEQDELLKDFQFELDKRHLQSYKDIVYDVGDITNGIFVLVQGEAQIEYPSQGGSNFSAVQSLQPGDLFGETAILEGRNLRNARVRTVDGPIQCYFFSRDDVVAVLSGSVELKERLEDLSARRYRLRAANALLQKAQNGKNLGKLLYFKQGERIFVKGEPAKHMYLVKSGVVKSIVSSSLSSVNSLPDDSSESQLERALGKRGDNRMVIAEWGPGDVFGISALYGSPRFASAVAETPVQVIEVNREELDDILKQEPTLRENLAQQFRTFKERSASIARKHTLKKGEATPPRREESRDIDKGASKESQRNMNDGLLTLKRGDILFRQGDSPNGGVFFVQEGVVHLIDQNGDVKYANAEGQTFGNESFVKGVPRRYTAVVASDHAKLVRVNVYTAGNSNGESDSNHGK